MAELTRKRQGELVRKVFEILLDHPDGLRAKDVIAKLEAAVALTDFELSTYPSSPNVRRIDKVIRFWTISSVKAGWLIKEKGDWSVTDEGRAAYERLTDPEAFVREAGRLYREWKRTRPKKEEEESEGSPGPAATLEQAEESAWAGIEEHLRDMNPFDFQQLVAGLLQAMGYHVSWISPPGPDRGVDIIAHSDPLGVGGPRIKAQVKLTADRIRAEGLRAFMALLGEGDVGLFVCTGGFTRDAESESRTQEKRKVMLVDLKRLFDLWAEHYDRIPEAQRRLLPLRAVHFLAPED